MKRIKGIISLLFLGCAIAGGATRFVEIFLTKPATTDTDKCEEVCYKGHIVLYCWDSKDVYWSKDTCEDNEDHTKEHTL